MVLNIKKRLLVIFMLAAVPMAYSDPISLIQETPLNSASSGPVIRDEALRPDKKIKIKKPRKRLVWTGTASWYSETDPAINRHTANGEVFDDSRLTCASWDHPFNTLLEVKNLANGKTVVCRVNDRGPNKRLKRLVDLTKTAFSVIADKRYGLIRVSVTKVSKTA